MPRGKSLRPPTLLAGATDAQLVALARDGSAEAFDAIVDRYRPQLLRFCAGLTRSERVDDAVQQTFMNAWLALGRGAPVRELRPWLYSIARNAAIDQLRLHRGDLVELSTELAGGHDPAAVSAARGEMDEVLRAVAELPERQRTALLETAVHGRATEVVADEMGMSGGALRQLVHRARTSVRGMVASLLPGPLVSWFAGAGGEEGTRRLAMLLTGAGQGATATALAATATVASVGAIGAGGLSPTPIEETKPRATATTVTTKSEKPAITKGSMAAGTSLVRATRIALPTPAVAARPRTSSPTPTHATSDAASDRQPQGDDVLKREHPPRRVRRRERSDQTPPPATTDVAAPPRTRHRPAEGDQSAPPELAAGNPEPRILAAATGDHGRTGSNRHSGQGGAEHQPAEASQPPGNPASSDVPAPTEGAAPTGRAATDGASDT